AGIAQNWLIIACGGAELIVSPRRLTSVVKVLRALKSAVFASFRSIPAKPWRGMRWKRSGSGVGNGRPAIRSSRQNAPPRGPKAPISRSTIWSRSLLLMVLAALEAHRRAGVDRRGRSRAADRETLRDVVVHRSEGILIPDHGAAVRRLEPLLD